MKQSNGFDPEAGNTAVGRALSVMISGMRSDRCPSEEEISSLVDGRVSSRERKTMLAHISSCDRCFQVFSLASELSDSVSTQRPILLRPLGLAASLFLVVLMALVVYKSGWFNNRNEIVSESVRFQPAVEEKIESDAAPPAKKKETGKISGESIASGAGSGRGLPEGAKRDAGKGAVKKGGQPGIPAAPVAAKTEAVRMKKGDVKKSSLQPKKDRAEPREARIDEASSRMTQKIARAKQTEGYLGGVKGLQHRDKVALLIGNSAYPEQPLDRAVSMTAALAGILTLYGFDVLLITDADSASIQKALSDFRSRLKKNTAALLYLNGFISTYSQRQVFIPLWDPAEKRGSFSRGIFEISPDFLFGERDADSVNILILETGYIPPPGFRPADKRMVQAVFPPGFVVTSAVEPGHTIAASYERSGLFTQAIIDNLNVEIINLTDFFQRVRSCVFNKSGGSQLPWIQLKIRQPFQFVRIKKETP